MTVKCMRDGSPSCSELTNSEFNKFYGISKEEFCEFGGISKLGYYVENGDIDTVKSLVRSGSDVNVLYGQPIRYAAQNGHTEIFKFLLQHGADIRDVCLANIDVIIENEYTEILDILKGIKNNI